MSLREGIRKVFPRIENEETYARLFLYLHYLCTGTVGTVARCCCTASEAPFCLLFKLVPSLYHHFTFYTSYVTFLSVISVIGIVVVVVLLVSVVAVVVVVAATT